MELPSGGVTYSNRIIRQQALGRGTVRGTSHRINPAQVRAGQRVRKDTKTHQDRWLAIDPDTCALVTSHLDEILTAGSAAQTG